ncbi:MAG: hypothetical protein WAT66_04390 [Actinomycetota bacterium]
MEFENLGSKSDSAVVVKASLPGAGGKTVTGVVRTRATNILERVLATTWQAFFGSLAAATITDISSAKRAALVALGTVVPALLSLVKNLWTSRNEG